MYRSERCPTNVLPLLSEGPTYRETQTRPLQGAMLRNHNNSVEIHNDFPEMSRYWVNRKHLRLV